MKSIVLDTQPLHICVEQSIIKSALIAPSVRCDELMDLIYDFVISGKCYSTELKEFIVNRLHDDVVTYIPDYMIENFDLFHNKGVSSCTDTQLAAIILSATKKQIDICGL